MTAMDQAKSSFLEIIRAGFAAGEVKTFVLAGGYFELIDAPYPVTVRLVDRYGSLRGFMTNAEASFYMRHGDFDAIEITSSNAQTIRFAYGTSEAGTRRTAGVVSVIDGERFRLDSGIMYAAAIGTSIVAGQYPTAQVWNPAGSGKNLIVKSVILSSPNQQSLLFGFDTVELATDLSAMRLINKKSSGSNSVAKAKTSNIASIPGYKIGLGVNVQSNTSITINPNGGYLVEPGFGLTVFGNLLASSFTANFEWFEEVI